MSTILMMRFNSQQGAVIVDESTWHLGLKYNYRRSNYGDSVFPLLKKETAHRTGVAAAYTGVGFPSFHFETAENAKAVLDGPKANFTSLHDIANVVFQEYRKVHERMIDDRMRILFGIGRDELNALSLQSEGRTVSIKQESVVQEARKTALSQERSESMQRITENIGAVIGYTQREGLQSYLIGSSMKIIDFAYPLCVLGHGSQIGSHIYGEIGHKMNVQERREGFDLPTGIALLLEIAVKTAMFECQMGGYFQLMIVDGRATDPEKMVVEIADHRIKLAAEISAACVWELLDKEIAFGLVQGLLLGDLSFEKAEEELFSRCIDAKRLIRCLTGYKQKQERFPGFEKLSNLKTPMGEEKNDDHQCHSI